MGNARPGTIFSWTFLPGTFFPENFFSGTFFREPFFQTFFCTGSFFADLFSRGPFPETFFPGLTFHTSSIIRKTFIVRNNYWLLFLYSRFLYVQVGRIFRNPQNTIIIDAEFWALTWVTHDIFFHFFSSV